MSRWNSTCLIVKGASIPGGYSRSCLLEDANALRTLLEFVDGGSLQPEEGDIREGVGEMERSESRSIPSTL